MKEKTHPANKTERHKMHDEMRFLSLYKIMHSIREGMGTKNEIKSATGLSWGSCSEIISMLEQKKIIITEKENPKRKGKQGRTASRYGFNHRKNLLIGMQLSSTEINCSLVSFGLEEISSQSYPLPETFTSTDFFQHLSSVFYHFISDCSVKPSNVLGLVIALMGGIDAKHLKWIFPVRISGLGEVDFTPLKSLLPSLRYLWLEHDINAQASSIVKRHKVDKGANYVFLHVGEGMGASVYDGKIYSGKRGFAGEVGHIPYPFLKESHRCHCGKINCVETVLSLHGIMGYINRLYHVNYKNFDEVPVEIWHDERIQTYFLDAMVYVMVILTNLLDPGIIIAGGEVLQPFGSLFPVIEKKVREQSWMHGPPSFLWYHKQELNCPYGAVLNVADDLLERYIRDFLL